MVVRTTISLWLNRLLQQMLLFGIHDTEALYAQSIVLLWEHTLELMLHMALLKILSVI